MSRRGDQGHAFVGKLHSVPPFIPCHMNTQNENSRDAAVHCATIRQQLTALIEHARADIKRVDDPRFQALLETSAEVLGGLEKAFHDFAEKNEDAWR